MNTHIGRWIGPALRALRASSTMRRAAVALALCVTPAIAQEVAPQVLAEQGLRFTVIERSKRTSVSPETDSAALFAIWGEPLREVTLALTVVDLLGRDDHSMSVTLDPASSLISTDRGVSWQSLDLSAGAAAVRFGDAEPGVDQAVILVRIGGAIAAAEGQRRGDYDGNLTLSATYVTSGIRGGTAAVARRSIAPTTVPTSRRGPAAETPPTTETRCSNSAR